MSEIIPSYEWLSVFHDLLSRRWGSDEYLALRFRLIAHNRDLSAHREELETKLSGLLCQLTNGRCSDTSYTLAEMIGLVEEVQEEHTQEAIREAICCHDDDDTTSEIDGRGGVIASRRGDEVTR